MSSRTYFKKFTAAHPDVMTGFDLGGGFRRIYHYHVRKTGGTSINHSFLSLGGEPAETVYGRLVNSRRHHVESGGRHFAAWDHTAIESGAYLYAFSHHPAYRLKLKPDTFTLTCFRDPVERVLSNFRMIVDIQKQGISNPKNLFKGELDWVAGGFGEFLMKIPDIHLLNQIYMFSERLDPLEAAETAAACNVLLRTEDMAPGLEDISRQLNLNLASKHIRKSGETSVEESDIERLREKLAPEYRFLEDLEKARPDFSAGERYGSGDG